MTFRADLLKALRLKPDASKADVLAQISTMWDDEEVRELIDRKVREELDAIEDPRERLLELAERLVKEKGITLDEAIDQVKRREPELVKEISLSYGPPMKRAR